MQVDWRSLLSTLSIPWADRGSNTSKGNVNIQCPWCGDQDHSHHLSIAEEHEAYFCYREPNRHSGRDFIRLLMRLGHTRDDAARLISFYRRSPARVVEPEKVALNPDKFARMWDRFAPATTSEACLAYLRDRGFVSPRVTAELFDLRIAKEGTWAQRLLIPLYSLGNVVSWTGRALRDDIRPKYLVNQMDGLSYLCAPDNKKPKRHTLVIVEGPLDALKIAEACRSLPYITAALGGKHHGAGKLLELRALDAGRVLVALDADVSTTKAYQTVAELNQALRPRSIGYARIPHGYKDPAEIPSEEIPTWLAKYSTSP